MERKSVWILVPVAMALVLVGLLLKAADLKADAFLGAFGAPGQQQLAASTTNWSSGRVTVPAGTCQVFNHNLGGNPDDYAVELWFMDTDNNLGINRRENGGLEVGGFGRGAYWRQLTENTVEVCRNANDMAADRLFVRVWQPPDAPDYDSGWLDIDPDTTLVITHGLGITATDLSVSLWFSSTAQGIHHAGYGGLADDTAQELHGAYRKNLTADTVRVTRARDDILVEQVRVLVTRADPPDYDSLESLGDWQNLGLGTELSFTHNLNWPAHLLLVRAECKSADLPGPGIHQMYAGGNHDWFIGWQGAHIQNLTENSIGVVRWVNDQVCPQARVRIWIRSYHVFLPLVVRDDSATTTYPLGR
jgi:hypothetical protein